MLSSALQANGIRIIINATVDCNASWILHEQYMDGTVKFDYQGNFKFDFDTLYFALRRLKN